MITHNKVGLAWSSYHIPPQDSRHFTNLSLFILLLVCYTNKNSKGGAVVNLPSPHPGKRPGQKYKSLLVLQYLLKNADNENAVTMSDILSPLHTTLHQTGARRNCNVAIPGRLPERHTGRSLRFRWQVRFSTNASEKPLFFRKPRLKSETFQRYCRERPVCRSGSVAIITRVDERSHISTCHSERTQ